MKYHHLDISTSGQVKEETEKSTRQRPSGVNVEGKPKYHQLQEDGTEVLPEEEATSTKPVPEWTENPLRIINLTHYNQDKTQPYPRK